MLDVVAIDVILIFKRLPLNVDLLQLILYVHQLLEDGIVLLNDEVYIVNIGQIMKYSVLTAYIDCFTHVLLDFANIFVDLKELLHWVFLVIVLTPVN